MGQIRDLQKRVYANKVQKGFNVTNVEREFCLLMGEVSEAYDAYIKNDGEIGDELADVAIYLLGLAEINGVDLEDALLKKAARNERRKYRSVDGSNGYMEKIEEGDNDNI